MSNTQKLLNRARLLCDPPSWYRLAKRTGLHPGTLNRCMHHGGTLDNEGAFKLAKLLEMEPQTVIAYIEEDRAGDEKKDFWRRQLPRLLSALGLAAVLGVVIHAEPHAQVIDVTSMDVLYIMRTGLRRWWKQKGRLAAGLPLPARCYAA